MRVEGSRAGFWFLALLVAIGSCGRGPGPSTPATGEAANDYFPMVPGASWVYELRSSMGNMEIEVTARGRMDLPDDRGQAFVMDERTRGPSLGFVENAPVAYLVTDGYVARIQSVDYDASGALRLLGRDEAAWILPLEATPGHAWTQETGLFRTPDGGGTTLGWRGEVRPRTSVRVPAGSFDDVAEVQIAYHESAGFAAPPQVVYRDYYARGVGLVRSLSEDPSGDPATRIELVLQSYRFPK